MNCRKAFAAIANRTGHILLKGSIIAENIIHGSRARNVRSSDVAAYRSSRDLRRASANSRIKGWTLLRSDTRDGFAALEFQRRCDDDANTLPLIRQTGGKVFASGRQVKWKSPVFDRMAGPEDNDINTCSWLQQLTCNRRTTISSSSRHISK
jgi:hypothetical protein